MVIGICMSVVVVGVFLWCVFQGGKLLDDILETFNRDDDKR